MVMTGSSRPRLSSSGIVMAGVLAAIGWMAAPARSCPKSDAVKAAAGCSAKHANQEVKAAASADEAREAPCAGVAFVGVEADTKAPCAKKSDCKGGCAHAPCGSSAHPGQTSAGHTTTFGKYMAQRYSAEAPSAASAYVLAGAPDEEATEARLSRLEAQLERLSERLERLGDRLEERAERGMHEPREPRAPREPREPRGPRHPHPPIPPRPELPPMPPVRPLVPGPDGDRTISMSYSLPEGKLQALTELMSRSDVPILISPRPDSIEVHATPEQQKVFGQFVGMIKSEEDQTESYHISPGKLEALTKLMIRSDVPILISPGDDRITVHGSPLEQEIFRGFVELIEPGAWKVGRAESSQKDAEANASMERDMRTKLERKEAIKVQKAKRREIQRKKEIKRKSTTYHQTGASTDYSKQQATAEDVRATLHDKLAQIAQNEQLGQLLVNAAGALSQNGGPQRIEQEQALERQADELQVQADSLRSQASSMEDQASEIEDQSSALDDQVSELEDRADVISDEAESADAAKREKLQASAQALYSQASVLQGKIQDLEEGAEEISAKAEELRERADSYEESAAAIRDKARSLSEQASQSDERTEE